MKWESAIRLRFKIVMVDGGRIGGGGGDLEIGGAVDANLSALRNPLTREPYIPGSSLKGKLRSTLEKEYGLSDDGKPCGCGRKECLVCPVFGAHMNTRNTEWAPARIVVRDACFTPEYRDQYRALLKNGKPALEEKTENIIDRKRGTAEHPRTGERLLPGAAFDAEILLHIYEGDDADAMVKRIRHALAVVQECSGIGASGSRGYGRVKFDGLTEETLILSDLSL